MSEAMIAYIHTTFKGVDGTCYSAAIIVAPDAARATELLEGELRRAGLDPMVGEHQLSEVDLGGEGVDLLANGGQLRRRR